MYTALQKLDKQELISVIEEMINDLKSVGMTAQYDKYKNKVEEKVYHVTPDKARQITRKMRPYGEMYPMDTVKTMMVSNGVPYDEAQCVKYYLSMNMYANDARQVAEENNMPLDKFCFVMAKTFINDVDACKYKVEKYFTEMNDE